MLFRMKRVWQSHLEPERQKHYELGDGYYVGLQIFHGELVAHIRKFTDGPYGLQAQSEGCMLRSTEFTELKVCCCCCCCCLHLNEEALHCRNWQRTQTNSGRLFRQINRDVSALAWKATCSWFWNMWMVKNVTASVPCFQRPMGSSSSWSFLMAEAK